MKSAIRTYPMLLAFGFGYIFLAIIIASLFFIGRDAVIPAGLLLMSVSIGAGVLRFRQISDPERRFFDALGIFTSTGLVFVLIGLTIRYRTVGRARDLFAQEVDLDFVWGDGIDLRNRPGYAERCCCR